MKVVILAGGLGSRLAEETQTRPKPMVEVGGIPILVHIMHLYAAAGLTDFVVCLGYKGYVIKEYFANFLLHRADVTFDLATGGVEYHATRSQPWKVTLVETGADTMTGGRVKRVAPYLDPVEPFCMTYGDGVADLDIAGIVAFHKAHGKLATLTAVRPPGRYGALELAGDQVQRFVEKPHGDNAGFINGGFFVLSPKVLPRIAADATSWEGAPLEGLAADGELVAYRHDGFWLPMDTLRDRNELERLWASGKAPWARG